MGILSLSLSLSPSLSLCHPLAFSLRRLLAPPAPVRCAILSAHLTSHPSLPSRAADNSRLTNSDFRKLLMTPRDGPSEMDRLKSAGGGAAETPEQKAECVARGEGEPSASRPSAWLPRLPPLSSRCRSQSDGTALTQRRCSPLTPIAYPRRKKAEAERRKKRKYARQRLRLHPLASAAAAASRHRSRNASRFCRQFEERRQKQKEIEDKVRRRLSVACGRGSASRLTLLRLVAAPFSPHSTATARPSGARAKTQTTRSRSSCCRPCRRRRPPSPSSSAFLAA